MRQAHLEAYKEPTERTGSRSVSCRSFENEKICKRNMSAIVIIVNQFLVVTTRHLRCLQLKPKSSLFKKVTRSKVLIPLNFAASVPLNCA